MRCLFLSVVFLVFSPLVQAQVSPLKIEQLRVEYQNNPVGIDAILPRFSWKLSSAQRNTMQKTYQIQVAKDEKFSRRATVWNSGENTSEASHLVDYQGQSLLSRQRYFWKVKVMDNHGNVAESPVQYFEMGLLTPADWQAQWIEPEKEFDVTKPQPVPLLRKTFDTKPKGKIASARLYVTSRGLNEIEINGKRVGDVVFTPGWTVYQKHLQYFTFDVTNLISTGANAIGAQLGDGWYRGYLAWENNRNVYGQKLALLAQLIIKYADGTEQIIGTDDTWKATTDGPIRMADIYMGEKYDARLYKKGWSSPDFDDAAWWTAKIATYPKDNLLAPSGPPVRRVEELKPLKVFKSPTGETVFDLGQNMVGWIRFKVKGPAGTVVTLNHAEVLDQKGNLYLDNLRAAKCEINYTLRGDSTETYEPRFTFMGFRYVRVKGWPGEPNLNDLVGVVVHSDMAVAGTFECSNPLLNQLQHNIVWGQKGNFVDVPTDCPQRDERLGWTGDAQAFSRTAAFNKDVAGFFTKWLRDVAADQKPNGAVPFVIPDVLQQSKTFEPMTEGVGSSGWGDVATIIPWDMYQVYADRRLLENQYESMKRWVEYIRSKAGDSYLWRTGFHFGDWLSYRGNNPQMGEPTTDNDFIATAFFAHSTNLLSKAALTLGKANEAVEYSELLDKIKVAFNREFVAPSGRLVCNTQTAYVLALHFDLLPENLRPSAVGRLVKDIQDHKDHLTTGFLGTPYLCDVLTRFGHNDVAFKLLNQDTYPSWLYPVKQGATTIWERWDGIKPDGSFQDVGMNSFNHYAYGAIGDWMYRHITGIDLKQAGYKKIVIHPKIGGGLTMAKATYETPYGTVASAWETTNGQTKLTVKVPVNTTATVVFPNSKTVQEGGQAVKNLKETNGEPSLELGSGEYVFTY